MLHHLCRGQLGEDVIADGVNKREFYLGEQQKIADFANKVHSGEIANAAGVDMVITNGEKPDNLYFLADGGRIGTLFRAQKGALV